MKIELTDTLKNYMAEKGHESIYMVIRIHRS